MNAMPRQADSGNGAVVTPVLRTLVMADLADSTALIERLGDVAAAAMMQRLDLHVRDLLAFTGGRLIDKADGLLALFERPVQAVDFALRYQRSLADVARQENLNLQARVGIHVGEVMTWENPPQAVAAGAKPLEVEGLAKPVAARLMSLAMPGQILLSGMAQTLAQRAQAELGERSQKLRWLVHGRYRFKGVPAPMVVHEVGETGVAPLRQPPSGAKAWREVPLWRRPPVLAAEAILVCGLIGGSLYSVFKSPPAIAFHERDWVVVGDMSNFTADPRLEQSLDTALRISLEQSRHVNLVPELKVQAALQRMGRDGQTTIDRAVGSEIALREGARALLLPSVAEVGGRLRVNIEVVDPATQVTVYAESAEGRGVESTLSSLDTVNTELRERLGESMNDIQASGKPLAQVTTANLDALRLYTLANEAARKSRLTEAMRLLDLALEKDPAFAMAYSGRAQIYLRGSDNGKARENYEIALKHRSRLSTREAMQLDANLASLGPPEPAVEQWLTFARSYPDAYVAYLRAAQVEIYFLQRYEKALQTLQPAINAQNPAMASVMYNVGMSHLGLGHYEEARSAFGKYESLGGRGFNRDYADVYAAQRRFAEATRVLKKQERSGASGLDLDMRLPEVTYALDQGRWDQGMKALDALESEAAASAPLMARVYRGTRLGLQSYEKGNGVALPGLGAFVDEELRHANDKDNADIVHAHVAALYGAVLAARHGDGALAMRVLDAIGQSGERLAYPAIADLTYVVKAELALNAGDVPRAVALMKGRVNGSELALVHSSLLRAYLRGSDEEKALQEAEWLAKQRGRSYVEWNSQFMLQPINVVETDLALLHAAEIAASQGQPEVAERWLANFTKAWPSAPGFAAKRAGRLKDAISASRRGRSSPAAAR
ncbi:putative peptide modification system cyclase [Arenimonas sp.]|uniref:putative peptide modification system cyclase n=1 Tax=Arenimonas sp. TaxID=1872635 RepID=UPI0039E60A0A